MKNGNDQELRELRRAEYATCGAIMAGAMEEVKRRGITASSFYFPAPRRVFKTVERLATEGKAADAMAVADTLAGEVLDGAPVDEVVDDMNGAYTTSALLPAFCETVLGGKRRRDLTRAARALAEAAEGGDAEQIAAARGRLAEVEADGNDGAGRGLVLVSDAELAARNTPPPAPVVVGLLDVGEVGLLSAPAKAGKSWFLLQMAKCVASGIPFLGRETRQGPAVYVNAEVGEEAWKRRSDAVNVALGIPPPPVYHASTRGQCGVTLATLPMVLKSALSAVKVARAALVVVDPFYALVGEKMDEDKADDVRRVFFDLQRLAVELGGAVMVAHHTGKGDAGTKSVNDRARGSSAFAGSPDAFFSLVPTSEEGVVKLDGRRRNGMGPEPRALRWSYPLWEDVGTVESDAAVGAGAPRRFTVEKIVGAFAVEDEVLSVGEVVERTGMGRSTAFELLREAVACGKLRKVGGGYGLVGEVGTP